MELEGIVSKRIGSVCERQDTRLAEDEEPGILEREELYAEFRVRDFSAAERKPRHIQSAAVNATSIRAGIPTILSIRFR